jgi:hypothetical protein
MILIVVALVAAITFPVLAASPRPASTPAAGAGGPAGGAGTIDNDKSLDKAKTPRTDGGPPAWAGGWKRVGKNHPGWSQEKWDRWLSRTGGNGAGPFGAGGATAPGCWPPGHSKGGGSGPGARPPRPLVEPSAGS